MQVFFHGECKAKPCIALQKNKKHNDNKKKLGYNTCCFHDYADTT